jgi:GNAT superfamily N-acetyltransferase
MDAKIRTLSFNEFQLVVEWAVAERWNIGPCDAGIFHATDPQGFFGAFVGDELAGAISAVAYSADFGFIGFFIVKPAYRGHMLGPALGIKAFDYLGARNIGVDGVEAKEKHYESHGFKLAYNNIRFEGMADDKARLDGLVDAADIPFDELVAYDRRFFPADRKSFLSLWINQPEGFSVAAHGPGGISGFGTIRRCRKGYKIGPLFADDPETAENIFVSLTAKIPMGEYFYLDVPEVNHSANAMAQRHKLRPVFKTARMYNRQIPNLPMENIYGVTSFELG